jgi:CHAT domain-containing protein
LIPGDTNKSAASIRASLRPGETIVEYFLIGDDLCIFVVRRDALVSVRRPGVVRRLASEWEELERHLASCSVKWERLSSVSHHLEATAKKHLHTLYQELIAPIEPEIRGTLVFAPHGFLHGIPLHALYNGREYLSQRYAVAYTPGAAVYCAPATGPEYSEPLLIAFSTRSETSSVEEIEQTAGHFSNAEVLINPGAAELRRAFELPRSLVHLAGHAGIDAVGGKLSWIETPEGRLSSRDLLDMQIRAKTLVITGCRTARRMIQPGDEWLGLMRSFYLSGASTIVSALWDVRAESARRFAGAFYETFDGTNAPAAVQRAAAAVGEWRAHPYFWAGFGTFARRQQAG